MALFGTMQATQKFTGSIRATTEFSVTGMDCSGCARNVTNAIQGVPGVASVTVSIRNRNAVVRWKTGDGKNIPGIIDAVKKAGYEARETVAAAAGHEPHQAQSHWNWTLMIGVVVTAILMLGEWVVPVGMSPWFQWLSFTLATVVQFFSGAQFYRGAWRQLKAGQSNMDTLVALGSTTAFGYSAWALLTGTGGHLYFMEAAAIITLISGGHWIEARVSDKAGAALKSLLNLAPETARRIRNAQSAPQNSSGGFNLKTASFSNSAPRSESEEEVPVSDLKIGDRVALRPGDRIPVDGIVVDGESAVDESMLTGESIPSEKKSGSDLFAGTVNINGRLTMRVTATGEGTALAHVISAVERAQTSRANIQRLGDRVSSVFVPVIVVIALAAGLWWGIAPASAGAVHDAMARWLWHAHVPEGTAVGFIIAAAVLIIACPCAMGLATPAAIMASANAASRRGILIRDGVALEKAGKITAIIFDKTGTLTAGKPEVAASWQPPASPWKTETLASALARNSTHPISRAIALVSKETMALSNWSEIRGSGLQGTLSDKPGLLRLGSLHWLRGNGVIIPEDHPFLIEWSGHGASVVGLALETQLLGLFAVRDAIKPGAVSVVSKLQRQGLKTFLVTGDNSRTAAGIARQVGIVAENVFAEARPEQKADFVKQLQAQNERVAFVGDGINDAPALTQSDLGIAVSRASDIAREAADIILLKSEIEAVPEALGLARATLRTIKQNLFWAFFYNAIGVPLAALGFISPIFCAAAMGFSDLFVIGNALRLLRWKQK